MSRNREKPAKPRPADGGLPCDGTAQDYRRHSHYGEVPCPESREAWRRAHRHYDNTGVYADRDVDTTHPFFFKRAARGRKHGNKRGGEARG